MLKRTIGILAAAACLASAALTAQAAEIRRIGEKCNGQACAWYLAEVQAPAGWAANEKLGLSTRTLALLPQKDKLSEADPLIVVRAGNDLAAPEDAGVERLADIARADGKTWQVYRIHDPARAGEEHEMLAVGTGPQGLRFAVSLSAAEAGTVESATGAWRVVLAQLEDQDRTITLAAAR